jgi:hypothetical protein
MAKPASVRVTVYVDLDQATAFDVFTNEIDSWYKRGPHTLYDASRAQAVRFEPYVGGRLMEVWDCDTGEGREMGRVEAWEPGERIQFVDSRGTEVIVEFVPSGAQTRVTLVHRGLERLIKAVAEQHAKYGWRLLMPWYDEFVQHRRSTL